MGFSEVALQERDEAMMLSQLTFRESESFDQGRCSETRRPPAQFWASLDWCPFVFFYEWLSVTFKDSHDPCVCKLSDHSRGGVALGGWRTGSRRKERVSTCGSVWGRIAPPPDDEFVGGGVLFWAFEDNDGDSNQGFKAGTLDAFRQWIGRYPWARSQL